MESISVIIPTYNFANHIHFAISSLIGQDVDNLQIIIVDDGSTDDTKSVVEQFEQNNVLYHKNEKNEGLGFSLNKGLSLSIGSLIAYLPADDIYFAGHLISLLIALRKNPDAILAYSGLKYNHSESSFSSSSSLTLGIVPNTSLQLVQVMHRNIGVRWTEREELTTDDYDAMFWNKIRSHGEFVPTGRVTAEWISHPFQRHKIISEFQGGGINYYKQYYNLSTPLVFKTKHGGFINERKQLKISDMQTPSLIERPLKILLVGELAYNPERIQALEMRGHILYGLWIRQPQFYNTTGPIFNSSIIDIPFDDWQNVIAEISPDLIYGLLNHSAVPLVYQVLKAFPHLPFVWHFKESPFYCRQNGYWNELVTIYRLADGIIYINEEMKSWLTSNIGPVPGDVLILDGDLPLRYFFKENQSKRLSEIDGEIHTVVPGRPYGLSSHNLLELAENNIHVHIYGEYNQNLYSHLLKECGIQSRRYLHLHEQCPPEQWTEEFSKYDAGWLHVFESANFGDVFRMDWNDLNYPARISCFAAAGIPMIQLNNAIHTVASENLLRKLGVGLFFYKTSELVEQLRDKELLKRLRFNAWKSRDVFTFDAHLNQLEHFFYRIVASKSNE